MEHYTLANGVEIPCIGLGTWQSNGDEGADSFLAAIEAGYRHIDTAQMYQNEEAVGAALKKCGIDRSEFFLTTKLRNQMHGYENTMRTFEESLRKLGTDYVDLFLIHWPNPIAFRENWEQSNAETWRAFEELYADGRVRSIGVSNFRQHHFDALMKTAVVTPMVNQIRLCPGETQDELVSYCRERNVLLEAYSPLGVGAIFEVPQMQELAQKYEKSIAQICIRWSLQRGYLPLPKSKNAERLRQNLQVFDFELDTADVQKIAELTGCVGFAKDPDTIEF